MRALLLAGLTAAVLCGGCIGSKTKECSWGRVCPADQYCEETLERCLYPEQATVCPSADDASPLEACEFPDMDDTAYACQGGFCLESSCGDGRMGPGEVCDDGNALDGDGCSADCLSTETCGNSIVDVVAGEGCDDGDFLSHDGCSSVCTTERMEVRLLATTLTERMGAAAAFDPVRQRVLVNAGFSCAGQPLEDTWEYDGVVWRELDLAPRPPARMDGTLAYVESSERMLMFGGWSGYDALSDTWQYTAAGWSALFPANHPSARNAQAMAYDPVRDRVVLFGGETAARVPLGDHWEFDGGDWGEITPPTMPQARRYATLAYDPVRQRVVLFGGSRGTNNWQYLDDTWEYDGVDWVQISSAQDPPPRHGHQLAWDPAGQRLVLHGGMNDSGPLADTWVYQGGQWSPLVTQPVPPRGQFVMAPDPVRGQLIVLYGHPANYQCHDDVWLLAGDDWTRLGEPGPKARVGLGLAYDATRDVTVMFGGEPYHSTGPAFGDTWQLADHAWHLLSPAAAPSARAWAPLVFDALRRRVVLFGGCCTPGGNPLGDTWAFDGSTWQLLSSGSAPTPRLAHALAYDSLRDEVVLFGGIGQMGHRGDAWRLAGETWTQVDTTGATQLPLPRSQTALAYDPARDRVVLFGGVTATDTVLADTWELGPDGWEQRSPAMSPPARLGHQMVFHQASGRVLLIGGNSLDETFVDLWEYDGHTWSFRTLPAEAPWRSDFGLTYDSLRREALLFGGARAYEESSGETWSYRYGSNWPDELCDTTEDEDGDGLVSCADPDCDGRACDTGAVCIDGTCQ